MGISASRVKFLTRDKPITVTDFTKLKTSDVISSIVTPLLTDEALATAATALRTLSSLQMNMNSMFSQLDAINPSNMAARILGSVDISKLGSLGSILTQLKTLDPSIANQFLKSLVSSVTAQVYANPGLLDEFKNIPADISTKMLLLGLQNFNKSMISTDQRLVSSTINNSIAYVSDNSATLSDTAIRQTLNSVFQSGTIYVASGTAVSSPTTNRKMAFEELAKFYNVIAVILSNKYVSVIDSDIRSSSFISNTKTGPTSGQSQAQLNAEYSVTKAIAFTGFGVLPYRSEIAFAIEGVRLSHVITELFYPASSPRANYTADALSAVRTIAEYCLTRVRNFISTVITSELQNFIVTSVGNGYFPESNFDSYVSSGVSDKAFKSCFAMALGKAKQLNVLPNDPDMLISGLYFYVFYTAVQNRLNTISRLIGSSSNDSANYVIAADVFKWLTYYSISNGYSNYYLAVANTLTYDDSCVYNYPFKTLSLSTLTGRVIPSEKMFFYAFKRTLKDKFSDAEYGAMLDFIFALRSFTREEAVSFSNLSLSAKKVSDIREAINIPLYANRPSDLSGITINQNDDYIAKCETINRALTNAYCAPRADAKKTYTLGFIKSLWATLCPGDYPSNTDIYRGVFLGPMSLFLILIDRTVTLPQNDPAFKYAQKLDKIKVDDTSGVVSFIPL